jgi:cell division protein FtsL
VIRGGHSPRWAADPEKIIIIIIITIMMMIIIIIIIIKFRCRSTLEPTQELVVWAP